MSSLNAETRNDIMSRGASRKLAAGDVLVAAGTVPDALFFVVSGESYCTSIAVRLCIHGLPCHLYN